MCKTEFRELFPSLLIVINSVVWFSLSWFIIEDLLGSPSFNDILLVSSSYFGTLLISSAIGATLLRNKLRKRKGLLSWVSLAAAASIFAAVLVHEINLTTLIPISLAFGTLAGLGIPSSLALFSETLTAKNRGRNSAVAFFLIQALTVLLYMLISNVNLEYQFLILAAWRLLGILGIIFYVPREKAIEERKIRLSGIIHEKAVILYFIPWFLFTIVNFVEQPLLEHYFGADLYSQYMMMGILITSISAILGGVICDYKGRKVSGILGFILLGIGYAFLSLLSGTQISQILWMLLEGVAWGILYVTFIFVVWGDISEGTDQEKYYFIGGMPFLLSNLISTLVKPFAQFTSITASFSIASIFLFLAILPLLYAPETLPAKHVKERELKNYLEKAMREREKYA
ncbi:MAG: MFS transporter [Candidatus Bathyarchaeales archaeon]